jgi:hypothetical protein
MRERRVRMVGPGASGLGRAAGRTPRMERSQIRVPAKPANTAAIASSAAGPVREPMSQATATNPPPTANAIRPAPTAHPGDHNPKRIRMAGSLGAGAFGIRPHCASIWRFSGCRQLSQMLYGALNRNYKWRQRRTAGPCCCGVPEWHRADGSDPSHRLATARKDPIYPSEIRGSFGTGHGRPGGPPKGGSAGGLKPSSGSPNRRHTTGVPAALHWEGCVRGLLRLRGTK